MKILWQFIRDDIWTHVAITVFCIGIFGLLVPAFYPKMPPVYGWVIFATGVTLLSYRVLKLSILLKFGVLTTANLVQVEHNGYSSTVRYTSPNCNDHRLAKRELYSRSGKLQVLYLPMRPSFHLVAWSNDSSDTDDLPSVHK